MDVIYGQLGEGVDSKGYLGREVKKVLEDDSAWKHVVTTEGLDGVEPKAWMCVDLSLDSSPEQGLC